MPAQFMYSDVLQQGRRGNSGHIGFQVPLKYIIEILGGYILKSGSHKKVMDRMVVSICHLRDGN